MPCMTFRTQSESISSPEEQQRFREEARVRRAVRFRTRYNCNEQVESEQVECVEKESKYDENTDQRVFGKLKVTFADIRIKEFLICLGDNPGGKAGPPLALSWIHVNSDELIHSLDEYEKNHATRKTGVLLILSSEDRINILRDLGYTDIQIKTATKKMATIRAQRRATYAALAFGEDWAMAIDSFKHLFRRERNLTAQDTDVEDKSHQINPSWISCTGGSTSAINHL